MGQSENSIVSIIGATAGGAIAGPIGSIVVGQLIGHYLPRIHPEVSQAMSKIVETITSKKLEEANARLYAYLNPQDVETVKNDLQIAFRDAFIEALYDLGGEVCFPKVWRENRKGVPDTIIYAKTSDGGNLWHSNSPLAEQICACMHGIVAELKKNALQSTIPTQEQNMANVSIYLEVDTPGELNDAFFDQVVFPYLAKYRSLLIEVPGFEAHLRRHLLDRTLVYLGELLKERETAWRAFNRMLLEGLRQQMNVVSEGQDELLQKLDDLLTGIDTETLAAFSNNMADLLSIIGHMEKALDVKLDTVLDHVMQQHGEVIEYFKTLQDSDERIETKVDHLLQFIEGNYQLPPVKLSTHQEKICMGLDGLNQSANQGQKFSDMFRGAIYATREETRKNPDWIAQSAHSFREILYPFYNVRSQKQWRGIKGKSLNKWG